jgi:outer membrane protein OmpA-like peptidoglycan-associated protein
MTFKWMPVLLALALPVTAGAQNPFGQLGDAAANAGKGAVEKRVNDKLLAEAAKNQCSFKSGTDQLAPGCGAKMQRLASALIDAKKQLAAANVRGYRFEVSGHTDSVGDAVKNKALSEKRAAVIVQQLVAKGVPQGEILSVGRGSEQLLVKPDDTEAKRAKNRRYELRVRL